MSSLGSDWDMGQEVIDLFGKTVPDEVDFCWGASRIKDERTIVFDLGYIDRAWTAFEKTGNYYQVGIGRLNWIPKGCPRDRADRLPQQVEPWRPFGNFDLICGQVAMDAQHNLTQEELMAYYHTRVWNREAMWRPHPQAEATPPTWPEYRGDPFSEDIHRMVVYNSTIGLEATLKGMRVDSHPSAFYHRAVDRQQLLNNVAYAQWTEEEIASGETWAFLEQFLT